MYKKLLILVLLTCSSIAHASPRGSINSWDELVNMLVMEGIDPNKVDWATINGMCNSFDNKDAIKNQCKYRKALQQRQFANDKVFCEERANLTFPDSLAKERKLIASGVDEDGKKFTITIIEPEIRKKRLKELRQLQKNDCVHLLGWNSGNRWQEGQR